MDDVHRRTKAKAERWMSQLVPKMNDTLYSVVAEFPNQALELIQLLSAISKEDLGGSDIIWDAICPEDRSLILGCALAKLTELLAVAAENAVDDIQARTN